MAEKLVSVCINSYNSEKYILETINSVINQSYKNLQIIVIDDCSTDNTVELIKSINDERIEFYSTRKNNHISFAYNESLKYIKGDYVARLDADDLWEIEKIEKQVNFLELNSQYGACFTHTKVIDETGNANNKKLDPLKELFSFENLPHAEMYRFFFDNSNKLCHSSSLIKTEVIKTVGNYDVSISNVQDFDYWMRLLTHCPIYIIPEPLTIYRFGGVSSNMSNQKWNAYNNEAVRVIYKSLNMCPDDLFLKAFDDKLKLTGEHTHEEIELEKALLLLEGPFNYRGNPILGLRKLSELFADEKYINLALDKFNFSTKDLYKFQETKCYIDIGEYNHLVNSLTKTKDEFENECKVNVNISNELQNCKTYINDLENARNSQISHIQNLEIYVKTLEEDVKSLRENKKSLEQDLESLNSRLNDINSAYNQIINSFSWCITSPLRYISSKAKKFLNVQKK